MIRGHTSSECAPKARFGADVFFCGGRGTHPNFRYGPCEACDHEPGKKTGTGTYNVVHAAHAVNKKNVAAHKK